MHEQDVYIYEIYLCDIRIYERDICMYVCMYKYVWDVGIQEMYVRMYVCKHFWDMCIYLQTPPHGQDVTQGQYLWRF